MSGKLIDTQPPRNTQVATSSHLAVNKANQSSSKPKFSFGKELEALSPLPEEVTQDKKNKRGSNGSWLEEAEAHMQRDLETSKKELELIKGVAEDIERRLLTATTAATSQDRPSSGGSNSSSRRIRDQKVLMSACQEYSRSRVHLLRQRLRQVAFWSNNRKMGQKTPVQAPADWAAADLEWAQWLGEQAAARSGRAKREQRDGTDSGMMSALWGPLPHLLDAYTSPVEERGVVI